MANLFERAGLLTKQGLLTALATAHQSDQLEKSRPVDPVPEYGMAPEYAESQEELTPEELERFRRLDEQPGSTESKLHGLDLLGGGSPEEEEEYIPLPGRDPSGGYDYSPELQRELEESRRRSPFDFRVRRNGVLQAFSRGPRSRSDLEDIAPILEMFWAPYVREKVQGLRNGPSENMLKGLADEMYLNFGMPPRTRDKLYRRPSTWEKIRDKRDRTA